jgi:glycosyltransferase involved in cell wall biosynthesis
VRSPAARVRLLDARAVDFPDRNLSSGARTRDLLSIVLLCESFGALGGVAQIVEELASQFALAGHRVAIVSNRHKGEEMPRQHKLPVEQKWVDLPRAKPFSLRHLERLWRWNTATELAAFLRWWAPDVINIHGGLRDRFPAVLAASRRLRVPLVQSFHLVPKTLRLDSEDIRQRNFSAMALRAASALTFPSSAVKEGFIEIWPAAERAQIIRGGVNLANAVSASAFVHQRPYIFSACRLDLRHKAVDVLIEAFRLLAAEFPDVDLLIAGDGPQRTDIESMISACGIKTRVRLLSSLPHDELWTFYKGALVFIMLSRMAEGLPLVFFEAMACSTPVIGTRIGGTPEIIRDLDTGLLLERNRPDDAAAAMRTLLTNPGQRAAMGRRGHELAKTYDWRAVASSYLDLYRTLVDE